MNIIWDEGKNKTLKLDRNLSFEIFADLILDKKYIDVLENPSRKVSAPVLNCSKTPE
jgi:uncharacterized DUF497 family protein